MEYYWTRFFTPVGELQILTTQWNTSTKQHVNRLSSDAISSAYDDRLDKKDSGVPGDLKSPGPGGNVEASRNR